MLANTRSGNLSPYSNTTGDKKNHTELTKMFYRTKKKEHLPKDLEEMSFWNQDKILENC